MNFRRPASSARLLPCAVLVAATAVAVHPKPGRGQAFAIHGVQSWSGYEELGSPIGLAIEITLPTRGSLSVRAAYIYRREEREEAGPTCTGLIGPGDDCPTDLLDHEFTLRTVEVGPLLTVRVAPALDLFGGASIGWTHLDGGVVGRVTGRAVDTGIPESPGAGWAASTGARWRAFPDPHWALMAEGRIEDLRLGETCGVDGWFAFCGTERFRTLAIGLEFGLDP